MKLWIYQLRDSPLVTRYVIQEFGMLIGNFVLSGSLDDALRSGDQICNPGIWHVNR